MGSNRSAPSPESLHLNLVGDVFTSLDELFTAGEAVQSLVEHPGWACVIRLVEAELSRIDRTLDGGLLESRAAYARAHGRRSGLRGMESAAHAIVSKATDRLEEQRSKHEGAADAVPMGV